MRFRAFIANLCLAATAALAATPLARAESLPEITEHSDKSFTVYRGDTVTVAVKASGQDLEAKWFKGHTVFCRTLACSIDTSQWEVGLHRLVFVVFNKAGSRFVRYSVRIAAAPADHAPTQVHPDMIPASGESEATGAYDLTVKSLHARGYSYHLKKLQVLGPQPRALDWTESLRTNQKGLLDFGRVGLEAHTLASNSSVRLVMTDEERRAIVLKRGTLRSRSLGTKDPRWSVVVPNLAQIDTDAQGDVLISRDDFKGPPPKPQPVSDEDGDDKAEAEDKSDDDDGEDDKAPSKKDKAADDPDSKPVTITVLRGYARVFVRNKGQDKGEDAGTAIVVGPGLSLTVRLDEDPGRPGLPDIKATAALVSETTSQYLPGRWEEGVANGLAFTTGAPKTKTLKAALAKASELRTDPVLVLEVLLPKFAEAKDHYEAQMLLGEAYQSLYFFKAAATAFKAATELKPQAPEPWFSLGEMALLTQEWSRAQTYLESANDKDYPDPQHLHYYLGVATYYAKDSTTAAKAFDGALWVERGSPEIALSARAFRSRATPTRWWDLRAKAGLLYDSNILRSDSLDPSTLGVGLTAKKGAGYTGTFGFSLWPWRSSAFSTEFSFDDGKTGYFTKSLSQLALIDQLLALRVKLGFGGGEGPKAFAIGVEAFARSMAIGGQASLDELGQVLTLSSPAFYDLRLTLAPTNAVDPLPARIIVVDPILWEVVTPGDRSARQMYYTFGATPVRGDSVRCDLDLTSGSTTYKSSYEAPESFRELGAKAHFDFTSTPRSIWSLGLGGNKRTFAKSDDSRKDTLMGVQGAWRWYFVPSLSQTLELSYDKQKSSRALNSYKRELFMYRLNWAL